MSSKHLIIIFLSVVFLYACDAKNTQINEKTTNAIVKSKKIEQTKEITAKQAYSLLENDSSIVVLDVRTPKEYALGHIAKAQNINVVGKAFAEQIALLDKSKVYLLHCRTQNRSRKALAYMQQIGFKHLYLMTGGFTGWQQEGFPVVK